MKLRYPIIGGIVFLISHLICHFFDLYLKIWWTDIAVHFITGMTIALFWWWLIERKGTFHVKSPKIIPALSMFTAATTVSVFWEYWEFSNWRYAFLRETIGRIQQQYYPYWGNNLGDIFWGMVGGIAVSLIFLFLYKTTRTNE